MSNTLSSALPDSAQPPSLSIQDLQNLLMVVDLASTRGAFRGPEMSQVGQVFDKLNTFLQSVVPPAEQTSAQPVPQASHSMQPASPPPAMPRPVMPMTPPFSPKIGG